MKLKIGLILTIILVFLGSANAQLLYKISKRGMKYDSYLFGTHHLVPVSFLDSIPDVFKAYNHCKTVVGEMVMTDPTIVKKMTDAAKMDESLKSYLSDDEYKMVDSAFQSILKMPIQYVDHLRPAMTLNMYEMALYNKIFPPKKDEDRQIDTFFQRVAEDQNIPVKGLETANDQIDLLFNSQSIKRQAQLLVCTVEHSNEIIEQFQELNRLYTEEKLDSLYDYSIQDTTSCAATKSEIFVMLGARNALWADELPDMMKQQPCFIAVGALHLVGKDGLIQLLRDKGYKVTAVK